MKSTVKQAKEVSESLWSRRRKKEGVNDTRPIQLRSNQVE